MQLAPTMCVEAGDLVGDVEDEGGEEGQRRYSIPSSVTKFGLDRMIIDAPGNDSLSSAGSIHADIFCPVRHRLLCRWAVGHFRLLCP